MLPPVMMEFCRRCPKVEFSTCTDMVTGLFDMVRQNDIDVLYFLDRRTNFPEWVKVAERRERALFVTSPPIPWQRRGISPWSACSWSRCSSRKKG